MLIGVTASLISAFSWAVSAILIKVGMKNKSPISVNIFRLYAVSLMFIIIFSINGTFSSLYFLSGKELIIAFISGQFGFVIGDYFYLTALKLMGVSRTVPITSTYPLWAILWAFLFLSRHINLQIIIGAVLVVTAIIIVRRAEEKENINPKGFIFALLAPLSWSFAILTMDWLSVQGVPVLTLAGIRMMFAAVGVSIFLPKYIGELKQISKKEAFLLIGAATCGLLIGQYLFVYSVNLVGSQIAAPVSAINPIIASFLAIFILKEPPNKKILEGLILAVIGVILISTA